MKRKTPAALDGRGTEKLGGFRSLITAESHSRQLPIMPPMIALHLGAEVIVMLVIGSVAHV